MFACALIFITCLVGGGVGAAPRDDQTVVVDGSMLQQLLGTPVSDLAVFRYDPAADAFVTVPFQVDERVARTFNSGTPDAFTELMYDVVGEDDGLLDPDDEVAFRYGDAGPRAPESAPWPTGAGATRYEILASDPLVSGSDRDRWVYLFAGSGLPSSPAGYMQWNTLETGSVVSDRMTIEYSGRWLLTGYRVTGCGSGADLIDRYKARAGISPDQGETEEVWNVASTYLGGLVGPVRAIRYVLGAASGFNTTHHDVISRSSWQRSVNLRVHPINAIWKYVDWLPRTGLTLFTPSRRGGVPLDGSPDGPANSPLEPWHLVRGPGGGMVFQYDIPASPLYDMLEAYLRDDANYSDAPLTPPYFDEDDAAWGNHGFNMTGINTSDVDPVSWTLRLTSLCSDEGDADLGDEYQALVDTPLQIQTLAQAGGVEITSLALQRDQADVLLDWLPTTGATSYRIFRSSSPDLPRSSWPLLDEVSAPGYRDQGAVGLGDFYYSVEPVTAP
jgi:hypothetical protein